MANKAAPGIPYYTPAQEPPAGTAKDPSSAPTLFQPLRIRGVTLHNRIVVAPMCTYSAHDGHLSDWHIAHLGQFAIAGAALTIVEATAVEPRGRISPQDSGIWSDSHVPALSRVVNLIHGQGAKAGIQLAHAGRKGSTVAPWLGGTVDKGMADESIGGWPDNLVGPSAIPYTGLGMPKELTVDEIKGLVQAFARGAERAVAAGFDVIEIHGAHGYLHSEFLSPLSNRRTDDYGGSFENRTRFLRETIAAIRAVIPSSMPLWLRISATEWMDHAGEASWDVESSISLARLLPALGVDVLDVSSGGNHASQRIQPHNEFQTDLAGQIRSAVRADGLDLMIAAVGRITRAETARSLLEPGQSDGAAGAKADIVMAARQFLRDPQWVLKVAHDLSVPVKWPNQYERAMPKPKNRL